MKKNTNIDIFTHPVPRKIAEKAVYWSVFLIIWHCILSAELTHWTVTNECAIL